LVGLPLGRSFDNRGAVNVSTPRRFTVSPQFGYTEGLGKISPSLNGLFFDLVANTSVHCELLPTLAGINFGEPGPMRGAL
jgi:hypothetical protein